jgi:DNA-binding MarR family transcriptional regulator
MSVLDGVSEAAARLYRQMAEFSERGICKANQRQLVAVLNIAFKTLIPARDELVRAGLVERIHHKRGRRDWYKIIPETEIVARRETALRVERAKNRADAARGEALAQLPLGIDAY